MNTLPSTAQERLSALRANRYFSGLDEAVLQDLTEHTHLYQFAAGENILWENEPGSDLCIIKTGRIKLFKTSPEGREITIKILEAEDSFNEVPVFDLKSNPANAAALELSQLWLVDGEAIRRLVSSHSRAALKIIDNLAQNLRALVDLAAELSFYPVTLRLVNFLLEQDPEILRGNQPLEITQDQLASRIGTVREVAARSLRELEEAGALQTSRGKIILTNVSRLREWD
ncbi:MAG: Crp/Fnr family transcriptional regulator [Anaerolineales bacterium]|nr:Crp/Fnr family transcriptional regulator [Anaerolineales bacterium]